jgi:hypothetical protein
MEASQKQLARIQSGEESERGAGACKLEISAMLWPTPRSASAMCRESLRSPDAVAGHAEDRNRKQTGNLEDTVSLWSTPWASDGEKGGPNMSFGAGGTPLPTQAAHWMTPRVTTGAYTRDGGERGAERPTLEGQATAFYPSSLPDPLTSTHGEPSSPFARTLNPLFVEMLMGWPLGWTGSEVAATEWCRWKRLMHGAFSSLHCRDEASPGTAVQASFF